VELPEISVLQLRELLESDAPPRLIDVREENEWSIGSIPGAELVPLSLWPAIVSEKLTDPEQPLVIQCHHGGRSARAGEYLLRIGFLNVKNLAGGLDAWSVHVDPSVPRY
jgi:rhodanese-related sulfurtransferase